MGTTTVRVDVETHAKLVELGEASESSLMETVRDAAEALRRQRFASRVADEFAALRADESTWGDYLAEMKSTNVTDGLG
jgi:predicted transcriptional regulator